MPAFQLNILDGVNSVGGNKIVLTRRGEGVLFDFGVNMKKKREYLLGHRILTVANKFYYYIYAEILPKIRGLYREDLLNADRRVRDLLEDSDEVHVQICVFSHAHLDHYGASGFLSKDIAVAVSNSMRTIMEAMLESSTPDIEGEIFTIKDRRGGRDDRCERKVNIFEEGVSILEAPLKVTPYPVDHSIPASFGFLVDDVSLAYTGDLRKHGLLRDFTEKFVEKIGGVDYLLIEGTRIDSSIRVPEHEVSREIRSYAREKADKLICVIMSPTDIDRLRDLVEAAKDLGKKPIICPKIVYLIDRLSESRTKLTLPDLGDVGVYFERRSLTGDGYDLGSANYRGWLKKVYIDRVDGRRGGELVRPDEVAKHQEKYFLIASGLDYVLELAQIRPVPGSRIIVSTSEPHDEEQEMEWSKFERWIRLLRLDLRIAHSSGHADRESLIEIINGVNPRKIIPIHTENPYEFQRLSRLGEIKCQVVLPKPGEPMTL